MVNMSYGVAESQRGVPMAQIGEHYSVDGFISGVPIVSENEASRHLQALQKAESVVGPLHYYNKMHLFMGSAMSLAVHSAVLDVVERCIGSDILLYNCTYIIKEPHSDSFVSWHQDLTYWGLSDDAQVSMWLALTEATAENGCMRMIPQSHKLGERTHKATENQANVLDLGQTIESVDESEALLCPLRAGEASFHHGWTMHASHPNGTDGRRVGLNVQYIAPHVRQLKQEADSAMLVRGVDDYGYYAEDKVISTEMTRTHLQALESYRNRFVRTYKS